MKRLLLRRAFWIPVLILAALGLLVMTVRFAFLAQTKTALLSGDLAAPGHLGKIMSPKVGCLYFANVIDTETFKTFLATSADNKAKSFVISLLGWKGRTDMLDCLKSLAAGGDKQSLYATLSVVALESRIPFPGRDIAGEYYRGYAAKALRMSKEKGIPLREAAKAVAENLRSGDSFE